MMALSEDEALKVKMESMNDREAQMFELVNSSTNYVDKSSADSGQKTLTAILESSKNQVKQNFHIWP